MTSVNYVGYGGGGHCGYCRVGSGYPTWGLVCSSMAAAEYEEMMLVGWRRCGDYYYKPDLPNSCCKLNTIRLNT